MHLFSANALVSWLDRDVWHFWLVASVATALWIWTVAAQADRSHRWDAARWTVGTLLLLLAWRWPYLVGPALINPDESQMIAGAITLKTHPLFWQHVDGTTHGPLADLPLLLANLIGFPLNYGTARFVAGVLIEGGFILAGRGLMLIYPPRAVRLGLAPAMLLWATIAFYDFSGYTSEQSAIFLLLAATWPLLAALASSCSPVQRALRLAIAGALLGAVPYAKLQGAPFAIAAIILIVGVLWAKRERSRRGRLLDGCATIVGGLAPSALVFVYLLHWRLLPTFWASYIKNNLQYTSEGGIGWASMVRQLWSFADAAPGLHAASLSVLALVTAAILAGLIRQFRSRDSFAKRSALAPAAIAIALLVGGITTTLAPHRTFGHYLQFLGIPLGLVGAIAVGELWELTNGLSRLMRQGLLLACLGVATVPVLVARVHRADPDMFGEWTARGGNMRYPASVEISRIARPGDTLSVWGWMPYFYAETGLPQATREAHTYRQIQGAMVPYYRARYLQDLQQKPPRIFVDAVGGTNFGYGAKTPQFRHECFPELAAYIAQHYRLHGEVAGSRIYVRKES